MKASEVNDFDEVLKVRSDLTRADLYDIIDIMDISDSLLDAANKFYPLNQGAGECGA
jgi:hypothetical protein